MWQCSKCGREFKNTNQDHYCGKINMIDEYIVGQPAEIRPILQRIREVIRAAPNATEKISWWMPTFWQGENLIHFAAFKKHIGILSRQPVARPVRGTAGGLAQDKGCGSVSVRQDD